MYGDNFQYLYMFFFPFTLFSKKEKKNNLIKTVFV